MAKRDPWFAANKAGVGFHPVTWQGWLVLLGGIAVFVALVITVVSLTD
jgi:hypothetical protein